MRSRRCLCLLVILCSAAFAAEKSNSPRTTHKTASNLLPVSTSSPKARLQFEKARQNMEDLREADALQDLRAAVKADPGFAQAYIMISHLSHDPQEQESARVRAQQLASSVSPGERLLIRWLAGLQEDKYVQAIAAMNDLLMKYPNDQRVAFLAGAFMVRQGRYQQAVVVLERAVTLDPNYAAALNELGYAYAFGGDFEKGSAAMERYVALEPDQPNPHDSYGEILRLAGKFDAALEQYRMSIKIDPTFGSELGVADTYALMGREEEARDEYARAIVFVASESEKVEYELQSAITWIREDNRRQAEHALREVAKHAHAAGLSRLEAEAHRVLAMYEPDYKASVKELSAAQNVLDEGHHLSPTALEEEQALILRVAATRGADVQATDGAASSVRQLERMAQTSRNRVVQLSYHAAAGAVLMARQKYAEAISHLEEDSTDPLSMRLLWRAYRNTGADAQAGALAERLAALNVPTVEQALVVPPFRASQVSDARHP